MKEKKFTDQLDVGDEMEPLEFQVTSEFNKQYLDALEDNNPIYTEKNDFGASIVHPGLLINYSNTTRSPSFQLSPGVAAVHAKEEVQFMNPARVGKIFKVTWKVVEKYEKRGKIYHVKDILMKDEDGVEILRRKSTGIFTKRSDCVDKEL